MPLSPEDEIIEKVSGSKVEFEIELVDENGRSVNTTPYDEFKICIKKSDGTLLEILHTAVAPASTVVKTGDPQCGLFKIIIIPTDSVTIKTGIPQDVELHMNEAADVNNVEKIVFENRLLMKRSVCG